ncbi:hypothetical protein BDFG_08574 [Blastomyces dermatitidis ATCC 26199]|nr:hypothetical protein BDFG_08574 [Blastomyces dermatitidis ATCC 26199]
MTIQSHQTTPTTPTTPTTNHHRTTFPLSFAHRREVQAGWLPTGSPPVTHSEHRPHQPRNQAATSTPSIDTVAASKNWRAWSPACSNS